MLQGLSLLPRSSRVVLVGPKHEERRSLSTPPTLRLFGVVDDSDVIAAPWAASGNVSATHWPPARPDGSARVLPGGRVVLGDFVLVSTVGFHGCRDERQFLPSGPAVVEHVFRGAVLFVVNAAPPVAVVAVDAIQEVAEALAAGVSPVFVAPQVCTIGEGSVR